MKITIYQMAAEPDNARLMFMDLTYVQTACGGRVPAWLYQAVYSGELEARSLEDVFYIFNMAHPEGYKGRSMSVSDVVEVDQPVGGSVFYFCDTVGFRRIAFDKGKVGTGGTAQNEQDTGATEAQKGGEHE